MARVASRPAALLLLVACMPVAFGGDEPPAPRGSDEVFRLHGVFVTGYASVPWHAAFSPDGRWTAIVEGYGVSRLTVHDAATGETVWRTDVEGQPASYRPAFSRDGRLHLVEGRDLVVRERKEGGWPVVLRVPLGFDPGVTRNVRPIALAPDGREAALCDGGRAWRARLAAEPPDVVDAGEADVVAASYGRDGALRVARWSRSVAETATFPLQGAPSRMPFALLASSPDDGTWLVARRPRPAEGGALALELLDGATRESRASVATEPDPRGLWALPIQVELTPDGAHLVTSDDGLRVLVRDARTGRVLQRIVEYEGDRLVGFAISPDGRSLLTGGRREGDDVKERAVLLWKRP